MRISLAKPVILAISLTLGLLASGTHAMAEPGKARHKAVQAQHDHKTPGRHQKSPGGARHDGTLISGRDRDLIRDYLLNDYRAHCPPGLAKKHNGCQPPGQAKKYRLGQPLQTGVFVPVAAQLLNLLSPAPQGHQYVRVDDDVLLISKADRSVVDAVSLLSAIGN